MTSKIPKLDLAFAISALPTDYNFGVILDVVKEVTKRFFSDRVRYGLIVFGKTASIRIPFRDRFSSEKQLESYIDLMAGNNDEPALDQALISAKRLFESEAARKDAQKVCVIEKLALFTSAAIGQIIGSFSSWVSITKSVVVPVVICVLLGFNFFVIVLLDDTLLQI